MNRQPGYDTDDKRDDVPEELYHEPQADGVPEDDSMESFTNFPSFPLNTPLAN